ncbi:hypothetical protein FHG87_016218 [Trinorchestia longiramus]|nr:hypothetical protein FHG87_016218 [Trinorchestia longiramus]
MVVKASQYLILSLKLKVEIWRLKCREKIEREIKSRRERERKIGIAREREKERERERGKEREKEIYIQEGKRYHLGRKDCLLNVFVKVRMVEARGGGGDFRYFFLLSYVHRYQDLLRGRSESCPKFFFLHNSYLRRIEGKTQQQMAKRPPNASVVAVCVGCSDLPAAMRTGTLKDKERELNIASGHTKTEMQQATSIHDSKYISTKDSAEQNRRAPNQEFSIPSNRAKRDSRANGTKCQQVTLGLVLLSYTFPSCVHGTVALTPGHSSARHRHDSKFRSHPN